MNPPRELALETLAIDVHERLPNGCPCTTVHDVREYLRPVGAPFAIHEGSEPPLRLVLQAPILRRTAAVRSE
jgi:hypothetical protein